MPPIMTPNAFLPLKTCFWGQFQLIGWSRFGANTCGQLNGICFSPISQKSLTLLHINLRKEFVSQRNATQLALLKSAKISHLFPPLSSLLISCDQLFLIQLISLIPNQVSFYHFSPFNYFFDNWAVLSGLQPFSHRNRCLRGAEGGGGGGLSLLQQLANFDLHPENVVARSIMFRWGQLRHPASRPPGPDCCVGFPPSESEVRDEPAAVTEPQHRHRPAYSYTRFFTLLSYQVKQLF